MVVLVAGFVPALVGAGCTAQDRASSVGDSAPDGTSTSAPATTASTTERVSQPQFDETSLRAAVNLVTAYFIALRSGTGSSFTSLFAPGDLKAAQVLFDAELKSMKTNEEAYAPHKITPLWRQGGRWFLDPSAPVPADLESWLAEQPQKRLLLEATMLDGSTRFFRVLLLDGGKAVLLLPPQL